MLIVQPPLLFATEAVSEHQHAHDQTYYIGALLALSVSAMLGALNVFLAGPLKDASPLWLNFYFGIACISVALCCLPFGENSIVLSERLGESVMHIYFGIYSHILKPL